MKSPEYVSTVTGAYREALDRAWEDTASYRATEHEKRELAEAFSRGFTTAFLTGERGNAMMGYKRPNNRGVAVGRVAGFGNGLVRVNATEELHVGDLLEVWTTKGRVTYTVDVVRFPRARQGQASGRSADAVSPLVTASSACAPRKPCGRCAMRAQRQGLADPRFALDVHGWSWASRFAISVSRR